VLPDTTADRLLAAGTLVAALALVAATALNWQTIRGAERPETVALASDAAQQPEETAAASPPVERPAPAPAPPPAPAAAPDPERLTISAAAGESWLEVRAGGAGGDQLFYGVLAQGEEQSFEPLPVWVRIGAVGNVELLLGEAPPPSIPPASGGVVEFIASADGLAPVGG
jgi:hypothetical protein